MRNRTAGTLDAVLAIAFIGFAAALITIANIAFGLAVFWLVRMMLMANGVIL